MEHLQELAAAWRNAKRAEDQAKEERLGIEALIAEAMPAELGSSTTEKTGDYKVSITYGVSRSVDVDALRSAWDSLQPSVHGAFRWKADVNVSAMKQLDETDAQQLSRFITTKPSKPSVKVEVL